MFTVVWITPKPTPVMHDIPSFYPDKGLKDCVGWQYQGCVIRLHKYILIGMAIFKANFTILLQR